MTTRARARAAPGFAAGEYLEGAFKRPAISAASGNVSSLADLSKYRLARRLDAVGAAAEIDLVQVEFENLLLREPDLQPERQPEFRDFACECSFLRQEQVFRELLRQRRAALRETPGPEVREHCPDHAGRIDTIVLEKSPVFRRNDGSRQRFGHPVERYEFLWRTAFSQDRAVARQHADARRVRRVPERQRIGKNNGVVDHHEGENQHRETRAENGPAKRHTIFEIQFEETLALPGRCRLRVRTVVRVNARFEGARRDGLKRSRKRPCRRGWPLAARTEQNPADKPQRKTQSSSYGTQHRQTLEGAEPPPLPSTLQKTCAEAEQSLRLLSGVA